MKVIKDLFSKQFIFPGGVITVGLHEPKEAEDKVQAVLTVALYGDVGGQANGENDEDDLFVTCELFPSDLATFIRQLKDAEDYRCKLFQTIASLS